MSRLDLGREEALEIRGRMHNTDVTTTSKLKSSYDDVVSKTVCITPS